jgi:hypothetical protein
MMSNLQAVRRRRVLRCDAAHDKLASESAGAAGPLAAPPTGLLAPEPAGSAAPAGWFRRVEARKLYSELAHSGAILGIPSDCQ